LCHPITNKADFSQKEKLFLVPAGGFIHKHLAVQVNSAYVL